MFKFDNTTSYNIKNIDSKKIMINSLNIDKFLKIPYLWHPFQEYAHRYFQPSYT